MLGHSALGRYAIGQLEYLAPKVLAETGAFSIVGQPVSATYAMPAGAGAFALTGQSASATYSRLAGTGSFAIAGPSLALQRHLVLHVEPTVAPHPPLQPMFEALGRLALGESVPPDEWETTFRLIGGDQALKRLIPLVVGPGMFTIAGQDVILFAEGYPPKIRVFPRVALGARSRAQGGGPIARIAGGTSARARAFGG